MKRSLRWIAVVVLLAVAASCRATAPDSGPRVVQPGSPGDTSRTLASDEAIDTSLPHTEADVRFMQGMIHHHAQALAMTDLAGSRAGSAEVRRLALRIALSQDDEIRLMQRWLRERGEAAPEAAVEHMHHLAGGEEEFMPGMLTHEQMSRLAAASGSEFDRLFLEYMIIHHEGALLMVQELFATGGAAQEVEIHEFAAHVEGDQAGEIRRMRAMLDAIP